MSSHKTLNQSNDNNNNRNKKFKKIFMPGILIYIFKQSSVGQTDLTSFGTFKPWKDGWSFLTTELKWYSFQLTSFGGGDLATSLEKLLAQLWNDFPVIIMFSKFGNQFSWLSKCDRLCLRSLLPLVYEGCSS